MAITIRKAKLGKQDVLFDDMGTNSSVTVERSDGTYRTVSKINASHVPITSDCRAMKQASGAAVGTTDVDATLIRVLDDLEDLGQPDATTIENSSGSLRIKAGGVSTAKIATGAVTANELASNAVTTLKILDANVTGAKIAGTTITASNLAADAVETAKIKDGAVTTTKITDGTITRGKINWDGSSPNVPMAMFPKYAGSDSVAGTTSKTVTVTGMTGNAIVWVMPTDSAGAGAYFDYITVTTNSFTVYWYAAATCAFKYIVFEPTA